MQGRKMLEAVKREKDSQFIRDDRRIRWQKRVEPFHATALHTNARRTSRRRGPLRVATDWCVSKFLGEDQLADDKVLVRDGELLEGLSDLLQRKIEANKRATANWKLLKIRLILYLSFEQSIKDNWNAEVF